MLNKVLTTSKFIYLNSDSEKVLVVTFLHISTYLSIDIHPPVMKDNWNI